MWTSLGFLTIFPVPRTEASGGSLKASLAYFPAVGLFLGLIMWALDLAFDDVLGTSLTGAVLVVAMVILTRGLHIEGLMDTCDGLFGGQSSERRLEIMKDSHAGAFAVIGGVSLILLKWAALVALLAPGRTWSLILFPALSRWAVVVAVAAFPYARVHGLGTAFHQGSRLFSVVGAGLVAASAAVLLGGPGGAALFGLATLLALLLGKGISSMLGGLTGDTYGAINEVTEAVVLIAAVGLIPVGLVEPLSNFVGGS